MDICDIMISKKGQINFLIYTAPCFFTGNGPVPMSLHLCNFEIQLQNYINHVVVQIFRDVFLCPVPLIPVLLSFLPLSPLGTFLFGRRWSSRRTGNIPSSWYKRWRWTQFATAIIVSKGNGDSDKDVRRPHCVCPPGKLPGIVRTNNIRHTHFSRIALCCLEGSTPEEERGGSCALSYTHHRSAAQLKIQAG